jgi:hypothetical protein
MLDERSLGHFIQLLSSLFARIVVRCTRQQIHAASVINDPVCAIAWCGANQHATAFLPASCLLC